MRRKSNHETKYRNLRYELAGALSWLQYLADHGHVLPDGETLGQVKRYIGDAKRRQRFRP